VGSLAHSQELAHLIEGCVQAVGELRDVSSGEIVPAAKGSGWRVQTDLGAVGDYAVLAKDL